MKGVNMSKTREIIAWLLHQILSTVPRIGELYPRLKEKSPQAIIPHIDTLYHSGERLWNDIKELYHHHELEFDVNSAAASAVRFHELSFRWKDEAMILSNAIRQIRELGVAGYRVEDELLAAVLEDMPNTIARFYRYIEYFSTIEENDLLHWDNDKIFRIHDPEGWQKRKSSSDN
jgi:hypothetical protein